MLRYRLSAYFARMSGVRAAFRVLALIFAAALLVSTLNNALDRTLQGYVTVTLDGIISNAVNSAALDALDSGIYSALVRVNRDKYGKISSVETDAPRVSRLKADVALRALAILEQPENREISVPLGTLLGGRLLHGRGPAVSIRLMATGAANTAVASEFSSTGINQTLHRIILEIDVAVTVIMPGAASVHTAARQLVLGETVIVGEVPDSYTYIDDTRDSELDKILDHR